MKQDSDYVRVVFRCHRDEIPGTVGICLDQIKTRTESLSVDESVFTRIKWVITELLTNAVKHSGEEQSSLIIRFDAERLELEKEDFGKPLVLVGQDRQKIIWPLQDISIPIDFPIYHNGMDSLIVRTNQSGKAVFFVEDLPEMEMPALLSDTSEHFGLLIMTKASDEFTYEYDPATKMNRFVSLFNLKSN